MSQFELRVAANAVRSLERLPEGIAAAVVEFMVGPLCNQRNRVGKALTGELTGYWSARRGAYRIVYAIDGEAGPVPVVRIEHRADVYRPR